MLEVSDLQVSYGRILALRGISFRVDEGEIVGLIGPNGAGKSTTLLTLLGVRRPDAGTIHFEGRSLTGMSPERITRRGLGLVPEGRQIFGTLTVEENLRLGGIARRDRRGMAADLQQTFERFPILQRYLHAPAGRLSGGEQQQLAIARALLSRPRLLLLDEPSFGLAPLVVDMVFERLDELRAEGLTVLLVEQNATRTVDLADRSYVLKGGRVELEGTRESLAEKADFAAAYLGA